MEIQWRENPLFRGTFLVLLLTLLYSATLIPRFFFYDEWKKAASDQNKTALEESDWTQTSLTKVRPTRTKYQDIQEILQYRRIPFSPILAALQKNIPKNVSLIKIEWKSDLEKTTYNIAITGKRTLDGEEKPIHTSRKATLKLNIYATPNWPKEKSPASWLTKVEADLVPYGILVAGRNIGKTEPYVASTEFTTEMEKGAGTEMEVTLTFQLEGPKTTVSSKKTPPKIRPPNLISYPADTTENTTPNPAQNL